MAQALDSGYTGIGNVQHIPAEQRIYGRTKEILRVTKGRVPMMRVMTENLGGKTAVTDMHIKYKSDYPLQASLKVAELTTSLGGGYSKLFVKPQEAILLREGTRLYSDRVYYNGTAFVAGVGEENTPVTALNSQRECLVVREKLETVGGGTPGTYFKVERGYRPAQGTSHTAGGTGTPVELASGWSLLIALVPQAIGDNTGGVYGDTPHEEENFCEITLEKMGVARTADRISMYQDKTILQRNSERQIDLFWKKNELAAIFGRKVDGANNPSPVDGSYIYETGGIDEYIRAAQAPINYSPFGATDADKNANIINFTAAHGALNYQSLNEFGRNKFYYGSEIKWWICDDIQYTKIANSFDNKVRINYNQPLSLKYGFKVNDLEISGGGTFHLAQSDLFSIYNLSNHGFIVDFDYFKPIHLQGEDFTIMVDVEKGLNPLKRVDYLYNNRGYLRNCPFAHYEVYNL
jgi:hypothetical protein